MAAERKVELRDWLAHARAILEGALWASPLGAAGSGRVLVRLVAQEGALVAILRERTRKDAPASALDPELEVKLRQLAGVAWLALDARLRDDLLRRARKLKDDPEQARLLGSKLLGALLRGTALVTAVMQAANHVGPDRSLRRGSERRRGRHCTLYDGQTAGSGDLVALWVFDREASDRLREPGPRAELDRLIAVRAPHVVPMREVVDLPGGLLGLVGDQLWSPSLADLLKKGSVRPVTRALGMTLDLLEAVRAVRAAGLRPKLDAELVVVTADATARLLLEPVVEVPVNLGHALGFAAPAEGLASLATLPPERLEDGSSAEPPGDVYELGALLYLALAGRPPFAGKTMLHVLRQVHRDLPPPLPDDVAPPVRALVERTLAKSPADRFADLDRFAEALRRARAELDGVTVPLPVPPRVRPAPPPLASGLSLLAPVLLPGMRLGGYTLGRELGRGAAGIVFLARDAGGLEVAVKVLNASEGCVEAFARFRREQRVLATLTLEEGFVPFLDAGESPHGPYVVMPFLSGGTLRARLGAGLLPVPDAVAIATALARALGAAHAAGIVHRDVKPENVLFTADGRPLLTDLGLAKHFSSVPVVGSGTFVTARGMLRGTFGYMPLEQMEDSSCVGPPADVFAWGAVAYELLAGCPAFEADGAIGVMQAVAQGAFAPLASVRPDAPPAVVAVVERALSRAPAARFADGRALVAALEGGRS